MAIRLYKTQGFVLKRKNYGESDRILTLFTREYGKKKVLAKGVRKITSKRASHLEIFTFAQFTLYQGRTFDHVTEVTAINQYESFRSDLQKTSFAYYICELIDRLLPENQEQMEIFEHVSQTLSSLARSTSEEDRHKEVYMFALDILWYLGFLPRNQTIPAAGIQNFIESVIERKMNTMKLFERE